MTGETLKGKIRKCTERKEDEMGINTSFARDVPAAMLANHAVKFSSSITSAKTAVLR